MKIPKVIAVVFGLALLASCVGTPLPGILFAHEYGPITHDQGGQIIRGTQVEGYACATSIFGLIAAGNASIVAAEKDALANAPGASALTNVTVDYYSTNFLFIVARFCSIVTGVPVK